MRLTIPQPQLLKTLQTVERAVNERSTLPILGNVLIQTDEGQLVLTATDLDVGIQCRFPLTSPLEQGAVTLPARKLATIVRELPEDTVTIEAKKNHTATLNCGASSFRIPGLPAEDFPTFPTEAKLGGCAVPQAALKAVVTQTAHAMSMEETRFILNGALMTAEKNLLTLVATDGRRLALATAPLSAAPKQPLRMVLPAKTMRELGRLLDSAEPEDVTIAMLQDSQATFRFGQTALVTRLLEGQFPQYEKVIPPPSKTTVTCNRQQITDAVRRASLMTSATSQAVVFELREGQLVVSKESAELGSVREELPATYQGPPLTVAFNPEYWLDAFKVLDTEEVTIEVSGDDKPAVIRIPAGADGTRQGAPPRFLYLVLPMKLS